MLRTFVAPVALLATAFATSSASAKEVSIDMYFCNATKSPVEYVYRHDSQRLYASRSTIDACRCSEPWSRSYKKSVLDKKAIHAHVWQLVYREVSKDKTKDFSACFSAGGEIEGFVAEGEVCGGTSSTTHMASASEITKAQGDHKVLAKSLQPRQKGDNFLFHWTQAGADCDAVYEADAKINGEPALKYFGLSE